MALIVEDGTGLTTAESYGSVADCREYLELRGITDFTDDDFEVEAFLREATEWIDAMFFGQFVGTRSTKLQALEWPRFGVVIDLFAYNSFEMPPQLIRATFELAYRRQVLGRLAKDEKPGDGNVTMVKVGPIEKQWGGRQGVTYDPQTVYEYAEMLLGKIIFGGSYTPLLERTS